MFIKSNDALTLDYTIHHRRRLDVTNLLYLCLSCLDIVSCTALLPTAYTLLTSHSMDFVNNKLLCNATGEDTTP